MGLTKAAADKLQYRKMREKGMSHGDIIDSISDYDRDRFIENIHKGFWEAHFGSSLGISIGVFLIVLILIWLVVAWIDIL